jgi:Gp45 protein
MSDLAKLITDLLAPLKRRVDGMVARVVISNVNDVPKRQELQVTDQDGLTLDGVEHFQPFGVSGYPPTGCDGVGFGVGGYRNHRVVMGAAPRIGGLPEKAVGDVLYHGTNPLVWTWVQSNGAWYAKGQTSWSVTLDGLEENQFITMTPGLTILQVQGPAGGNLSKIEITPGQVKITTPSGVQVF